MSIGKLLGLDGSGPNKGRQRETKVGELEAGLTPMPFQRAEFLEDNIFIHVHISKAGGSALTHGVAGIVGGAHVIDKRGRRDAHDAKNLSRRTRNKVRLYTGHIAYGVHRYFRQNPLYIATMREPVSRFVSYYRYVQDGPNHPAHERLKDLTLEEAFALETERGEGSAVNGQTRNIHGGRRKDRYDADDVRRRIENDYLLVIPNKRINHALRAMYKAFDLPAFRPREVNVGSGPKPEVPKELKRRIRAGNAIDEEIADWVDERFEQALERACDRIADGCRQYS